MSLRASTAGDLGDCIAGVLGVLFAIPGRHTICLRDDGRTKGIVRREAIIRPLMESQSYVAECKVDSTGHVEWPSEKFRDGYHSICNTLLYAHASHAKSLGLIDILPTGAKAWLSVEPKRGVSERIVISRSARYHNPHFPWRDVVGKYGKQLLFVGLPEEHYMFEQSFGNVEYQPTENLLDVGQLISGARMFIGNQSSAMTIAEGLKKPRIMEMALGVCDCVYPGEGAQYVADGAVVLPGDPPTETVSRALTLDQVPAWCVPPGGWQYDSERTGHVMTSNLGTCVRQVRKRLGSTRSVDEDTRAVLNQNAQRVPRFFVRMMSLEPYHLARRAFENAGFTDHPLLNLLKGDVKIPTNL